MVGLLTEQAIARFAQVYEQINQRWPDELKAVDERWLILNGVRMTASELQHLTDDLQREYGNNIVQRKRALKKLIHWMSR